MTQIVDFIEVLSTMRAWYGHPSQRYCRAASLPTRKLAWFSMQTNIIGFIITQKINQTRSTFFSKMQWCRAMGDDHPICTKVSYRSSLGFRLSVQSVCIKTYELQIVIERLKLLNKYSLLEDQSRFLYLVIGQWWLL